MKPTTIIGKREWISLPDLQVPYIKAKVDTGAELCSLHATNIVVTQRKDNEKLVSFTLSPLHSKRKKIRCKLPLHDVRYIKSSNGSVEMRFVVQTTLNIGDIEQTINITLTDRSQMEYEFLIGTEALKNGLFIDVNQTYMLGEPDEKFLQELYAQKQQKIARKLSIVVLASNPSLYSNKRIVDVLRERGHTVEFINISACYLKVDHGLHAVHYNGRVLEGIDLVIPRIRPNLTFYASALLKQLAAQGVYCLNNSESIKASRDKLLAYQLLAQKAIPIPLTAFAHSPKNTKDMVASVGGAPLIIKVLESTKGKGVILASSDKSAISSINAFKLVGANILIQEFIEEAKGADIRAFVIGKKVVGAIKRQAGEGEFRSNLHLGGKAVKVNLTKEQRQIAIRSARCLGLQIAGVDLIESANGIKVLEVNSSPGLEGIEKASKSDIAGAIADYVEELNL